LIYLRAAHWLIDCLRHASYIFASLYIFACWWDICLSIAMPRRHFTIYIILRRFIDFHLLIYL
jgi:hypothetical protein